MKSNLYDDGETYDKISLEERDVDFWVNLTKGKEGILELCCGTGRVIMSLLPYHNDITGIDNSKAMLAQAELKTKEFGDKVQLYKRNITRFNLGRTFDSILLINNSFSHLHTESEVLKLLECLKKHMTADTEFILETATKNIEQYYNFSDKLVPYANFTDSADGKTIEVLEKSKYVSADNMVKQEWFYYKEKKLLWKRHIYFKIFDPAEIRSLFTKNGFYMVQEYGEYDYEPFDSSSFLYIPVMKKIVRD